MGTDMSEMTAFVDVVELAEQWPTKILAALKRLKKEQIIDLDDALYVKDGGFTYVFFGPVIDVPLPIIALTVNRSYALTVEIDRPTGRTQGVLVSRGTSCGGFAFYLSGDNHLVHEYACAGARYTVRSDVEVPAGPSTLRYVFTKTGHLQGTAALFINDRRVGAITIPHTWPHVIASADCSSGQARYQWRSASGEEDCSFAGTIRTVMISCAINGAEARPGRAVHDRKKAVIMPQAHRPVSLSLDTLKDDQLRALLGRVQTLLRARQHDADEVAIDVRSRARHAS